MTYLMGIDLGTSGLKTVLFDETGKAAAQAVADYPLLQPRNGWAEQVPDAWWEACVKTIREVLSVSGAEPADIAGIGIAGQMHGLVMLDADGTVLRNCILWCDGRTGAECAEITRLVGPSRLIQVTANPALTGFTAGKILWVKKHETKLYERCRHILLPKDFLRWRLSGVYAGEVSDASGTNLLDVPKRCWSREILEVLGIDASWLPELSESCEVTSRVSREAAALTGLLEGTPIVGGAGDNAAAAIGTGIVKEGNALITLGTSGVIFAHSDRVKIDPQGRVHSFCSAVPGAYSVMSCTLAAGGALQWYRNQFCTAEMQAAQGLGLDAYELMGRQAGRIRIGADRLLFLPYLMGERSPVLDEDARGVFFGLSGIHTRYHLLRAVMEGVVYSQRECLDILKAMQIIPETVVAAGGGGRSPIWRQMLADNFDCPIAVIDNREGPALGAAILAGVGTGIWENVQQACQTLIRVHESCRPLAENAAAYQPYYDLYCELYRNLKPQFKKLAGLD